MGRRPVVGYVLKRFPRLSETFVLRELLELERLGVDVRVFALGHPRESTVHDEYARLKAPVCYLDDQPELRGAGAPEAIGADVKTLQMAQRFAPLVRAAGVTHLHAHFATAAGEVARALGHLLRVPYSVTAHAKDIFHESVSHVRLSRLLHEAAFVVTVSDYNVRFLKDVVGPAASVACHRIYNGIDASAFPFQADVARGEQVLGVGRLVEKKGFNVLIDAIALLRERRPHVHLTLVGTGRCEEALRRQIVDAELGSHVTLRGALPQHDVLTLMRTSNVLAVPCVVSDDGDRDGLPTVIIEAMALGLPVVSTPVTGIPEIVRHGSTGLLAEEGNAASLAEALHRMLGDSTLRSGVSSAARRLVEAEFDTRTNAGRLADLFAFSSLSRTAATVAEAVMP